MNEDSENLNRIKQIGLLMASVTAALCVTMVSDGAHSYSMDTNKEVCNIHESFGDPQPMTLPEERLPLFVPDDRQVELIGRLAKGIHGWKTRREHGWWSCGEFTETGPESEDKAILLAYNLVRAAHENSDGRFQINVWGLAATMAHESSFDRCAVGYHFRKWAIGKKLLKERKRTISYGERELLAAMDHPRASWWFDGTGVDVGYCQLLTRFYDGDLSEMMDEAKGVDICAEQFRYRAEVLRTNRPWKWWRGYKATWYDDRVTRRAKAMGARDWEI